MSRADVVAIGDGHGCASLLEQELTPHLDSGAELIFLGDLLDRAPEPDGDRRVLERQWPRQHPVRAGGVRPGIRLERQAFEDLIWIRRLFLSRTHGLPCTVMHGHRFRLDFQVNRLPPKP